MSDSTIWLDRRLFNEEVVARAAHRYTDFFHVKIHGNADEIGVALTAREGVDRPADLEARFRDDALDERLRESVRQETQGVHAELIRAALRETQPRQTESDR
jgi:His-Xaa-Ser system protein HxsD